MCGIRPGAITTLTITIMYPHTLLTAQVLHGYHKEDSMIYDSDGNEFPYLQLSILSGQQSNVVVIGVDAGDYMLTATQDSNTQVLARRNGTSDAFQDISITPIDLSALSGRILFDVKIDTDSGITSARIVQLISRSLEGQANWAG